MQTQAITASPLKAINSFDRLTHVFYQPGKSFAIDLAAVSETGEIISASGKTLAETQAQYPGAQILEYTAWQTQRDNQLKTAPTEITREQFIDALEVLPPENWHHQPDTESFKMCEYYCGRVTSIYVRLGRHPGARYFTFLDDGGLPHDYCVGKVLKHLEPAQ